MMIQDLKMKQAVTVNSLVTKLKLYTEWKTSIIANAKCMELHISF